MTTLESLITVYGSKQEALKQVDMHPEAIGRLTPSQIKAYRYLRNGGKFTTFRQMADDTGIGQPQKLIAVLAGLYGKGYLTIEK